MLGRGALSTTMKSAFLTRIGTVPYYVPSRPSAVFSGGERVHIYESNGSSGSIVYQEKLFTPTTLFLLDSPDNITSGHLQSLVAEYQRTDDVFSPSFLEHLLFVLPPSQENLGMSASFDNLFRQWGTQSAWALQREPHQTYRGGPYFSTVNALHQAWRIYDDISEAFMFPVVASDEDPSPFDIPGTAGIPVPSRLYFDRPTTKKPLSGLRTVIKDAIDLKGVRTSAGNRAYQTLHPPQKSNAPAVQQLVDAGAVIIGKTKLVQFSSGEMTRDWIDYLAPFNPRGDGYQDAGCSSTGSASAMSSYDFVDMALGTDTFGSILSPAAIHGLYGLRPSLGGISTDGVVPLSSALDTVGIFSRDINVMLQTTSVLVKDSASNAALRPMAFNHILYPEKWFATKPEQYNEIIDQFLQDFAKFLGTVKKSVDLDVEWSRFQEAGSDSIATFLHSTCANIQLHDCYHNNQGWRTAYEKEFGRRAVADPFIEYKWDLGSKIEESQYTEAKERQRLVRSFMHDLFLKSPHDNHILVAPCGRGEICYRGDYEGETLEEGASQMQGYGFWPSQLAVLAGLPWLTVPLSQSEYYSEVTKQQEINPVCIGLIGPPGSEQDLVRVAAAFFNQATDYRGYVHTGREAFPQGSKEPPNATYPACKESCFGGGEDLGWQIVGNGTASASNPEG